MYNRLGGHILCSVPIDRCRYSPWVVYWLNRVFSLVRKHQPYSKRFFKCGCWFSLYRRRTSNIHCKMANWTEVSYYFLYSDSYAGQESNGSKHNSVPEDAVAKFRQNSFKHSSHSNLFHWLCLHWSSHSCSDAALLCELASLYGNTSHSNIDTSCRAIRR